MRPRARSMILLALVLGATGAVWGGQGVGYSNVFSLDLRQREGYSNVFSLDLRRYYAAAVSPAMLDFGPPEAGVDRVRTFVLSNRGLLVNDTLAVSDITSTDAAFVVSPRTFLVAPEDSVEVTVTLSATEVGGHQGSLTASTNDPDQPQLTVSVSAAGTGGPVVVWSVGFSVTDAHHGSAVLHLGVAAGATNGLDVALGEEELPPPPPVATTLDARWIAPAPDGLSLDRDYRGIGALATGATWTLAIQADASDLPVTISWDRAALPVDGAFVLVDEATGNVILDLRTQSSYQVTTVGRTLFEIRYDRAAVASHTYDLPSRWSMVSLPLSTADSSLAAVFPTALSLFSFDWQYQTATAFAPGVGYWLNLPSPTQVTVSGWRHIDAALVRYLPSRWSMIGPGATALDVAALKAAYPQILSVFSYANGYQRPLTMDPGQAYWVNLSSSALVDLSGQVAPVLAKPVATPEAPYAGPVLWAEGSGGRQGLALGVSSDQVVELPPVPPTGLFDVRVEVAPSVGSWQVPAGDGTYPVRLQGGVERLRWQGLTVGGWELVIGSTVTPLVGSGEVAASDGAEVVLRQRSSVPPATLLHGAYPNPFNPSTTISYDLSEAGEVRLQVFAVSGQLVRQLVTGHQAAGAHQVEWDGRDGSGILVGNGVYLGVLEAGAYRAVSRMVLMK